MGESRQIQMRWNNFGNFGRHLKDPLTTTHLSVAKRKISLIRWHVRYVRHHASLSLTPRLDAWCRTIFSSHQHIQPDQCRHLTGSFQDAMFYAVLSVARIPADSTRRRLTNSESLRRPTRPRPRHFPEVECRVRRKIRKTRCGDLDPG